MSPAVRHLILSGLCFAFVHAAVKFIPRIPTHEIVVFRGLIGLALTWWAVRRAGLSLWGNNRLMLVFRGLAGTGALILYFHTLQSMPLASAVTIQYLHPILTVILATFFLRESATKTQWLFFALSFLGVLLVKGVDSRVTPLDLGLGIASSMCSALAYTLIRALRHQDQPLTVMLYLPLMNVLIIGPWTLFHYVHPTLWEIGVLIFIGVFTQIAQYFMTLAYSEDKAANISNLNYLGIVYAALIGYLLYDEHIDQLSAVGMLIITLSAILTSRWTAQSRSAESVTATPSVAQVPPPSTASGPRGSNSESL